MERDAPQADAGSANLNVAKPTEDTADRKASSPESGECTPTDDHVSVSCFIVFESSYFPFLYPCSRTTSETSAILTKIKGLAQEMEQ